MNVPLGFAEARLEPRDGVDLLLECHARIRRFVGTAVRLSAARDVPAAEAREAATALLRYFTTAYPLHVRDEAESLTPRVRGQERLAPGVARAIEGLEYEHARIDRYLGALVVLWRGVAEDGDALSALQPAMEAFLSDLAPLMERHLSTEEDLILPFARLLLSPSELSELSDEIRARRAA